MDLFIPILVLVSIPVYLGLRHASEYETFQDEKIWGKSEKIATLLLMSYLVLIVLLGKGGLYQMSEYGSDYRKFGTFFFVPSMGFAIAMFPRVAAEFFDNYIQMASTGSSRVVALFGWLMISILLFTLVF
ncbi:MAG: hypothetical protein ACI88A_003605 [Paraglaciecola sp.]|jgi:hypothetical protein